MKPSRPLPEALRQAALAAMAALDADLDRWLAQPRDRTGRIFCARGCSNCCQLAVHCTFPEALAAAGSLRPDQLARLESFVSGLLTLSPRAKSLSDHLRQLRFEMDACPFLAEDGACGVYPVRPLSCRGLFSTRNPDWCAVNLADLHPLERRAFLSSLDPGIVAYPSHYAAEPQEFAGAQEEELSWQMRERTGFSLRGNFPFLVWLEHRFKLGRRLEAGHRPLLEFLEEHALHRPFLVRLDPRDSA